MLNLKDLISTDIILRFKCTTKIIEGVLNIKLLLFKRNIKKKEFATHSLHLFGAEFPDVGDLQPVSGFLNLLQGVPFEGANGLHLKMNKR